MNNIEELLDEMASKRWLVSGVIQDQPDSWSVNLRREGAMTSAHGEGSTLFKAMRTAWKNRKPDAFAKDYSDVSHGIKAKTKRKRLKQ